MISPRCVGRRWPIEYVGLFKPIQRTTHYKHHLRTRLCVRQKWQVPLRDSAWASLHSEKQKSLDLDNLTIYVLFSNKHSPPLSLGQTHHSLPLPSSWNHGTQSSQTYIVYMFILPFAPGIPSTNESQDSSHSTRYFFKIAASHWLHLYFDFFQSFVSDISAGWTINSNHTYPVYPGFVVPHFFRDIALGIESLCLMPPVTGNRVEWFTMHVAWAWISCT